MGIVSGQCQYSPSPWNRRIPGASRVRQLSWVQSAIAADTLTNVGCGEFVFKYAIQRSASTEKECMVVKSKYRQGGAPGHKRVTQLLELEYFEFVQGRQ
jgi:hypothetical protein